MPAASASAGSRRIATVVRADARTGRLIRSAVVQSDPVWRVAVQPTMAQAPAAGEPSNGDLEAMVDRIASEEGVERSLVHSVIRAESNYNPRAVSPKGALGMMQLIPATAKRFGVSNVFDPLENVHGGVKYLKFLLAYYDGDYLKSIAAYNAGEAAVDKYKGISAVYGNTRVRLSGGQES